MSLAVAIVASLAVTMLVALWAARSASRWRAAQTLLVTLAPLAALAWLVTQAPPRGGGYALREAVRARASEVVKRGPPGSRKLVVARYARGVACVDGALSCPPAEVRADFTWALLGPEPMRREARGRLAALDAEPNGGAP